MRSPCQEKVQIIQHCSLFCIYMHFILVTTSCFFADLSNERLGCTCGGLSVRSS